jgi:hypothetical protein
MLLIRTHGNPCDMMTLKYKIGETDRPVSTCPLNSKRELSENAQGVGWMRMSYNSLHYCALQYAPHEPLSGIYLPCYRQVAKNICVKDLEIRGQGASTEMSWRVLTMLQ